MGDFNIGIVLLTLAGLGTGTMMWPMKRVRSYKFEQTWFVGMAVGLLIVPWAIVFTQVKDPIAAYRSIPNLGSILLNANLCALSWGIANILFGLCIARIGAALTGALLTGAGIIVGTIIPLIKKASGEFAAAPDLGSKAGMILLGGVALMLVGILIVTLAGFARAKALKQGGAATDQPAAGGFTGGLILCLLAGVLSAGLGFAFVYSYEPIYKAMDAQGASPWVASCAVWAATLISGGLVNTLYPAYLMSKNKGFGTLVSAPVDAVFSSFVGLHFIAAMLLMGMGMVKLGALGASVGWGLQQACQILGTQAVGFMGGEWKGVGGKARKLMYLGIVVLITAAAVMAYSTYTYKKPL